MSKTGIVIYDELLPGGKLAPTFSIVLHAVNMLNVSAEIRLIQDKNEIRKNNITELPMLFVNGMVKAKATPG